MTKPANTRRGRPRVPTEVEKTVLVRSRRRCCLCVGLQGDYAEKAGQIAHLDHNPGNNAADNLAFLCFSHHDEYDSVVSQRKGLQRVEVTHYRDALYELTARANQPAVLTLLQGKGDVERMRVLDGDALVAQAYEKSHDRELLAALISCAQAWYDDIIARLSIREASNRAPISLDFTYVWTRKYLPNIVAQLKYCQHAPRWLESLKRRSVSWRYLRDETRRRGLQSFNLHGENPIL